MVGAVGSMIFALFAMRQGLPGSPPFGIRADVLVFFWAQLAAAFALRSFMIAWAMRGSSGGPPPMPRPPERQSALARRRETSDLHASIRQRFDPAIVGIDATGPIRLVG